MLLVVLLSRFFRLLLLVCFLSISTNAYSSILLCATLIFERADPFSGKNIPSPSLHCPPHPPSSIANLAGPYSVLSIQTYSNQYCCPIIQCQCFLFLYRVGNEDKPKSIDSTSLCSDFFNRSYFVSETSQLAKMMQHWGKDGWFSIGLVAVKTNHVFFCFINHYNWVLGDMRDNAFSYQYIGINLGSN